MPNAQEFSELIRTGGLDFALLKPIDTQFLVSFAARIVVVTFLYFSWAWPCWLIASGGLRRVQKIRWCCTRSRLCCTRFYVMCGVLIMYSVMISLSATSIWLGRNQTLYNFWFLHHEFFRANPMEIYGGAWGSPLRNFFTFVIPILIVVNVPARIMAWPMGSVSSGYWKLPLFALFATGFSLVLSRWVFRRALLSYRSASS